MHAACPFSDPAMSPFCCRCAAVLSPSCPHYVALLPLGPFRPIVAVSLLRPIIGGVGFMA